MFFTDRYDAAMQLAPHLEKYKNKDGVILAVPRGGVPIGYFLAKHLELPLDLLMTKKLGHPANEEYAIGAVSLSGSIIEERTGVSEQYIKEESGRIRQELSKKYKQFMGNKEPADVANKIVILVDDGIATGRTMLAALQMIRNQKPEKLVVAVPVASPEAANRIEKVADEFICLHTPFPFYGVGRFYDDFGQTSDEEVQMLLNELNAREKAA